MDTSITILL